MKKCFAGFDYDQVAGFGEEDIERILTAPGMIRSRRKAEAVIHNARCFRKIRDEFGSFSKYLWGFTGGKTYLYMGHQKGNLPAWSGLSDRIGADLKKRGLKYFVVGRKTIEVNSGDIFMIPLYLPSYQKWTITLTIENIISVWMIFMLSGI